VALASVYDVDALIAAIGDAIDVDAVSLGLFDQPANPASLAAARARAMEQARQITGNLVRAELTKIAAKVEANIAAGNNPRLLIGQLSEIAGLDSGRAATLEKFRDQLISQGVDGSDLVDKVERMRAKLLRDRRETIARTEQRMATERGKEALAKERGVKFKLWITAGDDRVSEDICLVNEAQGWIAADKDFSSGDSVPPGHPNCRCTVTYRKFPPSAQDERRAEESSEETQAAVAESKSSPGGRSSR
jgi:hypothetical protein